MRDVYTNTVEDAAAFAAHYAPPEVDDRPDPSEYEDRTEPCLECDGDRGDLSCPNCHGDGEVPV